MKNPYPINPFLQLFVKVWMTIFSWYYRISANITKELIEIDEPYLLLSNHYGRYDPFIISNYIKKRPNFISSDAILREKVIGTLFKGLGAMPKKKGVRDTYIIREMLKVVQRGGALALFPEGTRTWSGESLFIDPSIAKLVKLLKIPVITARMKGAYAFDPRWAKTIRRAAFEIDYKMALSKADLIEYSEDKILAIISANLYQDDIEFQRQKKIKIRSNKRAEHLDLVLFQCPACESFNGFNDHGNQFACKSCHKDIFVDEYGFFSSREGKQLPFDNIKDWLGWQNRNFVHLMGRRLAEDSSTELFRAVAMNVDYAVGEGRFKNMGIADVYFYPDKLKICYNDFEEALLFSEISSLGPQFHERIELFYKDRAYRITSTTRREPGIKWELAINTVWAKTGQIHKLSPYFKNLVLSVSN
jgi:1-acyl-sn-glycerol-3-phosphate acyltransferase